MDQQTGKLGLGSALKNFPLSQGLLFFINIYLFYYLFLATLGLCFCVPLSLVGGERGLLFIAVCGLLIAVASLVAQHGL